MQNFGTSSFFYCVSSLEVYDAKAHKELIWEEPAEESMAAYYRRQDVKTHSCIVVFGIRSRSFTSVKSLKTYHQRFTSCTIKHTLRG